MKRYVLFLLVVLSVGLSVQFSFSETIPSGLNRMYFQKFFAKQQPKEYYDFPTLSSRVFYPDVSQVYSHYQAVEDFSQSNAWGIISPSEQFSNTRTNKVPVEDSDLLQWRTFQRSDVNYALLPSVDRSITLRQSPPSIMGIRSLFLNNGNKVIKVYPKTDLFLPSFNIHFVEFWIFSINLPYDVFISLQDHRGMLHRIYVGNMKYFGWRRLRATLNDKYLGFVNPTLLYTRATETRLKVNSISFESQDPLSTAGFFGAWMGDLGVVYTPDLRIPDSISSPAAKLSTSFDWNEPENNQARPAPADSRVTASAGH